ncbi:hypothetical protein [Nostoc sp.]|uniref:hypothetical protein n=1 Tax=Nostoc sp. TaxID=1180 RepID=UPI002FFAA672
MNNQLYEQDFNLWRESIIEQIKQHPLPNWREIIVCLLLQLLLMLDNGKALTFSSQSSPDKQN